MESAKKALGLTKYFIALPPARHLAAMLLFGAIIGGALLGGLVGGWSNPSALLSGAGSAIIAVAVPSFGCALALSTLRRRVKLERALAIALLSSFVYMVFYLLAFALRTVYAAGFNLIFVGFGLSFLLWFSTLKFAFGLRRSAWLFAIAQMLAYTFFLIAGTSIYSGGVSDLLVRIGLAAVVFVGALYGLLFIASGPLKKNLGLSSPDVLSMFSSQWLYGEKDLEDAFDEMGETATTWVGVAEWRTPAGKMHWVVPYLHFGPFGNLGGSQFSFQIAQALKSQGTEVFVFHGTATHDLDPVSSSELAAVVGAARTAIAHLSPKPARFSLHEESSGDSTCYLLGINNYAIASFTRAPLSTEDVNLAIGWALMEKANAQYADSLVIDCHNAETGDVDYVEAGSPISFDMADALDKAMKSRSKAERLLAGWASEYPIHLPGVGSGGIKVACFGPRTSRPNFVVLLDSNGITQEARERLIESVSRTFVGDGMVEIYTTDTHQLNSIKGVFNPAGAEGIERLERIVLSLAKQAHAALAPASFDMKKERLSIKVLGPYQSAEIVSTLNSVVSVLRIAVPAALILSILALLWLLARL